MLFVDGMQEVEDPGTFIDLDMIGLEMGCLILTGVEAGDPDTHLLHAFILHAFTPFSIPEPLRFCQVWP